MNTLNGVSLYVVNGTGSPVSGLSGAVNVTITQASVPNQSLGLQIESGITSSPSFSCSIASSSYHHTRCISLSLYHISIFSSLVNIIANFKLQCMAVLDHMLLTSSLPKMVTTAFISWAMFLYLTLFSPPILYSISSFITPFIHSSVTWFDSPIHPSFPAVLRLPSSPLSFSLPPFSLICIRNPSGCDLHLNARRLRGSQGHFWPSLPSSILGSLDPDPDPDPDQMKYVLFYSFNFCRVFIT